MKKTIGYGLLLGVGGFFLWSFLLWYKMMYPIETPNCFDTETNLWVQCFEYVSYINVLMFSFDYFILRLPAFIFGGIVFVLIYRGIKLRNKK